MSHQWGRPTARGGFAARHASTTGCLAATAIAAPGPASATAANQASQFPHPDFAPARSPAAPHSALRPPTPQTRAPDMPRQSASNPSRRPDTPLPPPSASPPKLYPACSAPAAPEPHADLPNPAPAAPPPQTNRAPPQPPPTPR